MARKRILLIFAATILSSPASAADNPLTAGLGWTTCGQFLQKPQMEDSYFEWAQGFMSGRNSMFGITSTFPKDLTGLPLKEQKAMIRSFCVKHHAEMYDSAVPGLYAALPKMKRTQ
jgi:hypothetical protein